MVLKDDDKKLVQQTVIAGGHVNTNGMDHRRAEEIRAEEVRLREQQNKK